MNKLKGRQNGLLKNEEKKRRNMLCHCQFDNEMLERAS